MGNQTCPNCEKSFTDIGKHWAHNPTCEYPEFSPRQQAILDGLFCVGGNIFGRTNPDKTPKYRYLSTDTDLLRWVSNNLQPFVASCREASNDSDVLNVNSDWEDVYCLSLVSHPDFERYSHHWYTSDGNRTIPSDITPTPRLLRTVYTVTGRIQPIGGVPRAIIQFTKTRPSEAIINRLFDGFAPTLRTSDREVSVLLGNTTAFFDYIGWNPEPPAKESWPTQSEFEEPSHICHSCNGRYEDIGKHWASSCEFPALSVQQRATVLALLVVGTHAERTTTHARIRVLSGSENLLQTARTGLDWLVAGASAPDSNSNSERTSRLSTWSHPEIEDYLNSLTRDAFEDELPDEFGRPEFYRVVFDASGTRGGGEEVRFDVSDWRVSDEAVTRMFEPFSPSIHTEGKERVVVLSNAERFFAVIGDGNTAQTKLRS